MSAGPWLPGQQARRSLPPAVANRMPAWGHVKDTLLIAALVLAGGSCAVSAWTMFLAWRDNRAITDLAAGRDLPVESGSRLEVKAARAHFLLQHDRIEDAQALVSEIKVGNDSRLLADVQYNLANARLRAAFALIEQNKIDAATSFVGLARDSYRAALTTDPGRWDARYNLDVAIRLVRDFSPIEQNAEETSREAPKRMWTDFPGTPKGLP
jgi:mxaK protein